MELFANLFNSLLEACGLIWHSDFLQFSNVRGLYLSKLCFEVYIKENALVKTNDRAHKRVDVVIIDGISQLGLTYDKSSWQIQLCDCLQTVLEGLDELEWLSKAWHVQFEHNSVIENAAQLQELMLARASKAHYCQVLTFFEEDTRDSVDIIDSSWAVNQCL